MLGVLEAFDAEAPARLNLERFLLATQLADGGWNCLEGATHSSFNTTTAALEALLPRAHSPVVADALGRGRGFLSAHGLYRSHRTGAIVKPGFIRLRWPIGWEADVLRQLDHFAAAGAPRDPRLEEAVDRIRRRRRPDGRWICTRPQPGAVHFELEPAGRPSRWVTLKCLRILKWWGKGPAQA